jgi:peptide-methionine (S)-S-oxide reductase
MNIKSFLYSALGTVMIAGVLPAQAATQSMIVAGGCFWCVESDFEKVEGVSEVVSGYIGGSDTNATYKEVSKGRTGHYEAVKITFDDEKVSLEKLSEYFWKTIDPTDPMGQFCDKGSPYLTGMFYQNEAQKTVFQASLDTVNETKPFAAPVVTKLLAATPFYVAEEYHQDYYKKNPIRYNYYRKSCGREARVKQLWGDVASKHIAAK